MGPREDSAARHRRNGPPGRALHSGAVTAAAPAIIKRRARQAPRLGPSPVLILGIDPGSRYTGWGLLRWQGDQQQLVADGLLQVRGEVELPERLASLQREIGDLIELHRPDAAAVEAPYYGMNPKSLIVLAQARGAILAAIALRGLAILEYSPAEVKTAIAGNGRADKKAVARMVRLLLRLGDDDRSADTTDAIAVALCCARRYKLDRLRTAR